MSGPEPEAVLRVALSAWGLGHLAIGRRRIGAALLVAEVVGALLVWWLTVGLADTSAYLVPFLAGVTFIVIWTWQAVAAYQAAHVLRIARPPTPARSPAAAIAWMSVPLLIWGSGFWLIGAQASTPEAVLDTFVTEWSAGELDASRPARVLSAAATAERRLGTDPDRFRDLRIAVVERDAERANAVAESIHYERRDSRFLWVFPGSELVPVRDDEVLALELAAEPASLPFIGDVGAVRWALIGAELPSGS
ncbi:MAG: hypothetical protein ABIO99_07735 [Candidatus Limnocylindria bacterium]